MKEVPNLETGTWRDPNWQGHHLYDKKTREEQPKCVQVAFKGLTTRTLGIDDMTGEEHVQFGRDTREGGPAFAAGAFDRDRAVRGEGFVMF